MSLTYLLNFFLLHVVLDILHHFDDIVCWSHVHPTLDLFNQVCALTGVILHLVFDCISPSRHELRLHHIIRVRYLIPIEKIFNSDPCLFLHRRQFDTFIFKQPFGLF